MYQLIYISHVTIQFPQQELVRLLRYSGQWNDLVGTSGVLRGNDEYFVQVLAGGVEAIGGLYGKLLRATTLPKPPCQVYLGCKPLLSLSMRAFLLAKMGLADPNDTFWAALTLYSIMHD